MNSRVSNLWPRMVFPGLLLAVLALTVGCTTAAGQSGASEVQPVSLKASDFSFVPSELTVRAGKTARLTLINEGRIEHDFTVAGIETSGKVVQPQEKAKMGHAMGELPAGTVHVNAEAGQRISVDFTPKSGSYEFYCSVAGHREAGMRGTLRVS